MKWLQGWFVCPCLLVGNEPSSGHFGGCGKNTTISERSYTVEPTESISVIFAAVINALICKMCRFDRTSLRNVANMGDDELDHAQPPNLVR